jgi:cyclophilin family peptidyl-prolyl cis-trans isomerase
MPMLRVPSFQKCLPFVLVAGIAPGQPVQKSLANAPHFTIHDAIQAEWMRAAPNLKVDALPKADRERYQLTLQRIGAPGMPKLLPPELENPTVEIWEAKAKDAKTPQERFTALHFLNRLKSPKALGALDGLRPEDAKTWPNHLYLDANIATARLQGCEASKDLQGFLDEMKAEGKVEPVRAQAARLRLILAGKEKAFLPPVKASPGALLALMDAWNRGPWENRKESHLRMLEFLKTDPYFEREHQPDFMGFSRDSRSSRERADLGLSQRLLEGLDGLYEPQALRSIELAIHPKNPMPIRVAALAALAKWPGKAQEVAPIVEKIKLMLMNSEALFNAATLPVFRKFEPTTANTIRTKCLFGSNPIVRSAAIEDLSEAPTDLDSLTKLTWNDRDLEPQQTLIESYSRWKLPKEKQIELLKPWLQHSDWGCRYLAYLQLVKLDATTTWPTAPAPNKREKALLAEAERLASSGKPLRLRMTFSGKRQVTLRLDPKVAPINIANLSRLARKGFFNGRLVPRVVPDFVVQMGSPYDTMDGGPGYSVRCEDSLIWYGPGSVGMALSGKDTGGSQLFITTNATPHLTGKYTRMGEVEDLDRALKILDDLELGAKIEQVEVLK